MIGQNKIDYVATAFISCSLREEDKPFINLIEKILLKHRIRPFGTVGRHSSAPINPAEHMQQNVPLADFVVIVATQRYLQKDLQTGQINYGLSEMVHVETGMAFMANKPVVVFVKEGTHVGNFLPNITEYVVLSGNVSEVYEKWGLINSLLNNAYKIVLKLRESQSAKSLENILLKGLAFWGGYKILDAVFTPEKPKKSIRSRRRRRPSK